MKSCENSKVREAKFHEVANGAAYFIQYRDRVVHSASCWVAELGNASTSHADDKVVGMHTWLRVEMASWVGFQVSMSKPR